MLIHQGRLWQIDTNGCILNDAHHDYIQPPFDALVRDAVQAYVDHIGQDIDSIYVTGSVSRGLAVAGESDLNMFAVTTDSVDPDLVLQDWIMNAEEALIAAHDCVRDVQLELWPYYYVFNDPARFSIGGFILKTYSVCLWGGDLAVQLPEYRLTPAIANDDIVQVEDDLQDALSEITDDPTVANVRYWCERAAKSVLRSGFGLVQMAEGVHTRDVDLCCAYFVRHYPQHAGAMARILDYAQNPVADGDAVARWLAEARHWFLPLADAWLDDHNPARDPALLVDDQEEIET